MLSDFFFTKGRHSLQDICHFLHMQIMKTSPLFYSICLCLRFVHAVSSFTIESCKLYLCELGESNQKKMALLLAIKDTRTVRQCEKILQFSSNKKQYPFWLMVVQFFLLRLCVQRGETAKGNDFHRSRVCAKSCFSDVLFHHISTQG